jgi:hypothetical protein
MTLSPTQAAILAAAAQHPQHLIGPPPKLAPAPREAIRKSLLGKGLIEPATLDALDTATAWPADGGLVSYRITAAGLMAVANVEPAPQTDTPSGVTQPPVKADAPPQASACPPQAGAAQAASQGPTETIPPQSGRTSLRDAVQGVLQTWDATLDRAGMDAAITALRTALAGKQTRPTSQAGGRRKPRAGTKQQLVLALLRRPEGATVAQIAEATGWQHHTVRGFFAALKARHGIAVTVQERVRQVGPGKEGAKGSYSIYRLADAG